MSEEIKVVLLGEAFVGKTCIINKFFSNEFNPNTTSNLSSQYVKKKIEFEDGKSLSFDIWDTIGQEKFRSLNKLFYQGAKAIILVYDITNKKSFNEMKDYWYKQIMELGNRDIILVIDENKNDLYEKRQVSSKEGEEFAKEKGAFFASTSALNGNGIEELFENIGRKILNPDFVIIDNEMNDDYKNEMKENKKMEKSKSFRLNKIKDEKSKKKKSCC